MSKYLSFILRHSPESIELSIDKEGWACVEELISKTTDSNFKHISLGIIKDIIQNSKKIRFELSQDEKFIRAIQGHSTDNVNRRFEQLTPPCFLYHGTSARFLHQIQQQGLTAQERQYVHLSTNALDAREVGKRHGKPTVIKIQSLKMHNDKYNFYLAENDIWLTHFVPIQYIDFEDQ